MFSESIDYTVCSTNEKKYNRINCNLTAPITKYAAMTITCLTTNCNIVVLNEDDYIMINGEQFSLKTDYTNLNSQAFSSLLNDMFSSLNKLFTTEIDESGRFKLCSNKSFHIDRMTYNFQLITGFYNSSFPIYSDYDQVNEYYFIRAESVGFTLSTPILYLISNVGMQSYRNVNQHELSGAKIVMRLNNSFSSNCPIIVNNADFTTTILSNDLASLEFSLVDAYMHEVKLLSPMYLSINIRAIKEETIPSSFELSAMQERSTLFQPNEMQK